MTVQWYDDFNQETFTVQTTLNGSKASWTIGAGSDAITFNGTFTGTHVEGDFTGPRYCKDPYKGIFKGDKVG